MTEEFKGSFEEGLEELERVVARLEEGELSLEESLALFERGIFLARHCGAKLKDAEGRLEKVLKDANSDLTVVELDTEGEV